MASLISVLTPRVVTDSVFARIAERVKDPIFRLFQNFDPDEASLDWHVNVVVNHEASRKQLEGEDRLAQDRDAFYEGVMTRAGLEYNGCTMYVGHIERGMALKLVQAKRLPPYGCRHSIGLATSTQL